MYMLVCMNYVQAKERLLICSFICNIYIIKYDQDSIIQIVHGGKLLRLHAFLVIHGKSFTIAWPVQLQKNLALS